MGYPMSEPRLFKHRAPQFGAMRCLGLRSNDVEQSGVRELLAQSSVVRRHICLRGQHQIALSTACLLQPEQLAGSTAQQEPKGDFTDTPWPGGQRILSSSQDLVPSCPPLLRLHSRWAPHTAPWSSL